MNKYLKRTCKGLFPETELLGLHGLRQRTIRKAAIWMLAPVLLTLLFFYPVNNLSSAVSFLIVLSIDIWLLMVAFVKNRFRIVSIAGVFVFYAAGFVSIFMKGVGDMGSILLFSLPITAGYLLGFRWALLCICANMVSLLAFRYMHTHMMTVWNSSPLSWDSYIREPLKISF